MRKYSVHWDEKSRINHALTDASSSKAAIAKIRKKLRDKGVEAWNFAAGIYYPTPKTSAQFFGRKNSRRER